MFHRGYGDSTDFVDYHDSIFRSAEKIEGKGAARKKSARTTSY
jgi:hypothetical protein